MVCFESTKRQNLTYRYFDILYNIHFDYKMTTYRNKLSNASETKPAKMLLIIPPKSRYVSNQFSITFTFQINRCLIRDGQLSLRRGVSYVS